MKWCSQAANLLWNLCLRYTRSRVIPETYLWWIIKTYSFTSKSRYYTWGLVYRIIWGFMYDATLEHVFRPTRIKQQIIMLRSASVLSSIEDWSNPTWKPRCLRSYAALQYLSSAVLHSFALHLCTPKPINMAATPLSKLLLYHMYVYAWSSICKSVQTLPSTAWFSLLRYSEEIGRYCTWIDILLHGAWGHHCTSKMH